MKPSEMMRQMKALLPPDSTAGTYFIQFNSIQQTFYLIF